MEECIGNPRLSPEQLAQLCLDVAASGKPNLSADQQNFVRVLADNDRLIVLPEMRAFQRAQAWSRRRQGCRDYFGLFPR
jgi:F0F1-type ATP synthase delta subunit